MTAPPSPLRDRPPRSGATPTPPLSSVPDGRRVTVAGLVLVRQRPGNGKAIFLTLEDEKTVANIIFWARTFDRYRPVIMGARFVRVTGKLQCESDVIHIVADKIEDLTPWLSSLLETGQPDAANSPATGNRLLPGPSDQSRTADRVDRKTVPGQDFPTHAEDAQRVMPKGRNFH